MRMSFVGHDTQTILNDQQRHEYRKNRKSEKIMQRAGLDSGPSVI